MTTPPDTDVRAARAAAAQSAGRAGRWPLARLLLRIAVKLLLLSAVTSSMPACIIPVAPDFQDPDGIPNAQPEILSETPNAGSMVSATVSMRVTFQITVTDVNVTDTLHIRWLVDELPREAPEPIVMPHPNGEPLKETLPKTVRCQDVTGGLSLHHVRPVVADRDFDDSSSDPMAVKFPGKRAFVDWWLTLDCPLPAGSQP